MRSKSTEPVADVNVVTVIDVPWEDRMTVSRIFKKLEEDEGEIAPPQESGTDWSARVEQTSPGA